MPSEFDETVNSIVILVTFLPFLAAFLAVPLAFVLLWLYRRTVLRHMMAPASTVTPEAPAGIAFAPTPTQGVVEVSIPTEIITADSAVALPPEAATLRARLLRVRRSASGRYLAAGFLFALFGVVAMFLQPSTPEETAEYNQPFVAFAAVTNVVACFLWPTAMTLPMMAGSRGKGWWFRGIGVAFVVQVILLVVAYALLGPTSTYGEIALVSIVLAVAPSLPLAACGGPRLRSIGPLVLASATVLMGAVPAGLFLNAVARALPGGAGRTLTAVAAWVAVGLFLYASVRFLAFVARQYDRRSLSDHMIWALVHHGVFTLWVASLLVAGSDNASEVPYALATLLVFPGYWLALRLLLRPLRREAQAAPNLRLLLLRVFGSNERSERLFEEIVQHWRFVGTIQMIAGTDLAGVTIEPHEFLNFLSGRMKGQFVTGPDDLRRKWDARDLTPDPDGRYRVDEFFCHDDTWQSVLVKLMEGSDVVLMDLRGFSQQRQGCVFELHRLVDQMPLGRVVLIVDETTDVPFLQRVLDSAWLNRLPESPNRDGGAPLRLFATSGKRPAKETAQLLSLLSVAATETTPGL